VHRTQTRISFSMRYKPSIMLLDRYCGRQRRSILRKISSCLRTNSLSSHILGSAYTFYFHFLNLSNFSIAFPSPILDTLSHFASMSLAKLFIVFVAMITATHSLPTLFKRFTGEGTFYNVGLGACGQTNSNSDYVAALVSLCVENGNSVRKILVYR